MYCSHIGLAMLVSSLFIYHQHALSVVTMTATLKLAVLLVSLKPQEKVSQAISTNNHTDLESKHF